MKLELHQKELSIRELKSEKNKYDCELRQSEEERRKLEQKLNILTEQVYSIYNAYGCLMQNIPFLACFLLNRNMPMSLHFFYDKVYEKI